MQNSIIFLKSVIFYLIAIIWMLLLTPFAFMVIILLNDSLLLFISKLWARGVVKLLELICNLKIKVSGTQNITKQPVILAAKHQSALETLFLYGCLDEAKFVLKNSLKYIPILGLCFIRLKMIFIDRTAAVKSIRHIKTAATNLLSDGKSLIIFPEGTRVNYGQVGKYNPGVAALYDLAIADVIPVALDTGKFWPKNSLMKYPGVCHITFLAPIEPGLDKKTFMKELELRIEKHSIDFA